MGKWGTEAGRSRKRGHLRKIQRRRGLRPAQALRKAQVPRAGLAWSILKPRASHRHAAAKRRPPGTVARCYIRCQRVRPSSRRSSSTELIPIFPPFGILFGTERPGC